MDVQAKQGNSWLLRTLRDFEDKRAMVEVAESSVRASVETADIHRVGKSL